MLLELALNRLVKIGTLTVTKADGTGSKPFAAIKFRTKRAERRLFFNPALALGEAYMDGDFEPVEGSLYDTLDFLAMNSTEGGMHPLDELSDKLRWITRRID